MVLIIWYKKIVIIQILYCKYILIIKGKKLAVAEKKGNSYILPNRMYDVMIAHCCKSIFKHAHGHAYHQKQNKHNHREKDVKLGIRRY